MDFYHQQLESQHTSSIDSITLLNSVQNKFDKVIGITINQKLINVLQKNVGFNILQKISNTLTRETTSMEELLEDLTGEDLIYFKYACITSTDVERNFSRYKNILSDNRRRFYVDNLKKALVIQSNKFTSIKKKCESHNIYKHA